MDESKPVSERLDEEIKKVWEKLTDLDKAMLFLTVVVFIAAMIGMVFGYMSGLAAAC